MSFGPKGLFTNYMIEIMGVLVQKIYMITAGGMEGRSKYYWIISRVGDKY